MGMDIGRTSDLTVMWIVERISGQFFTRKIFTLQNKTFSEQEAVLYDLLSNPAIRRTCIDSTGLGMQLAERAQEKFGTYRVEGVRFSAQVKEELAYPVRAAFEDKAVKIPRDDQIRADLRGIKKVTTTAGNIRFEADRGANGHSDRFWALALAIHAAAEPMGDVAYKTTTKRRFAKKGAW
jgi:phage FluMu gp28-like protein